MMRLPCVLFACAVSLAPPAGAQELPTPQAQAFSQLSLQAAEADTLARSPDVAIARGKVEEARALFDSARSTFGPALMANYAEAPQGADLNQTVAQRLSTVGAQWTLGDLLAYSPAVAQANAALRAAQLDLDDAERTQAIAAVGSYYAALEARAALRARDDELASAKAELRAAKLRFASGDAPRLDVVRASVAVSGARADLALAQAASGDADAALAQATGVQTETLQGTAASPSSPWRVQIDAPTAIAQALAVRPDVASAQGNVAAEEHAVAVARRGGLPLITVAGGYTRGVDTGIDVAGPSVSAQMLFPLGAAAHDRVLAEEARLAQARAQLVKVERGVELQVGDAVRAYQARIAALSAARQALRDAQAELRATQIGYRSGAVSSLDLDLSRTAYVTALVAHISALYAQAEAGAALALVIGGPRA